DYTFNSADAGVQSFTLTLNTSGNQSLSVVDVNNPLLSASATGSVNAAAASALALSFPATAAAGVAQPLTVTAVDPFGNVATSYKGTVTFSSSDAQASLPANYIFTGKDGGSHTFSVTLNTVGAQSVTVADTASPALSATRSGI